MKDTTEGTMPSVAAMKVAIRETRERLAVRLARTAGHVHLLFTTPSSGEAEASGDGLVAGAVKVIAVAGRSQRVWTDARRTGLLRGSVIGGVAVAIGAALVMTTRRRRLRRTERLQERRKASGGRMRASKQEAIDARQHGNYSF